jgi:hypothetical protein
MVEGSGDGNLRAGRERSIEKENPPRWEQDDAGSMTSAGVKAYPLATLANIQPSEAKLCVTPFAGPVEPEVKKMAAGASGSGAGNAIKGGSASIKRSKRGPPSFSDHRK